MKRSPLAISIILISATVLTAISALADFSNHNSMILGERASGMGGAFTSLYNDPSAVTFYNPAGLAFFAESAGSAEANVYKKFDTVYGQTGNFTTASLRVNQGFFRAIPAASGSVFPNLVPKLLPDWNFAFNIVVPDYDTFTGEVKSTADSVSLLTYIDESLWVGGGMAKKLTENSSFGISAYYTARNFSRNARERIFRGGSDAVIFSEEKAVYSNSAVLQIGYQEKLNELFRWGALLRLPSFQISGTGSYFQNTITTSPFNISSVNETEAATLSKIPAKFALGASYQPNSALTWSCDLSLVDRESYSDMTIVESARDERNQMRVINLNLGTEYKIYDWLALRTGAFTNFSSNLEPDPTPKSRQGDRIDQAGFSANLSALVQKGFQVTFGGYYTGGRGQSTQMIDQQLTRIPKSTQVFTMLVGTSMVF